MSNASELFWSWISINQIQVHEENEFCHRLFTSFTKHYWLSILTGSRAVDGKEMCKKVWCMCKVFFLSLQAIAYLTFSSPPHLKLPIDLRYIVMSQKQNIMRLNTQLTTRSASVVSGQSFGSSAVSLAFITSTCSVQCFRWGHSLGLAFGSFFYLWGWTLVAFTELVEFRGVGLDVGGVWQHLEHLWGVGIVRLALGSCLAFVCFFMLSIGGCLRVWCIGAQASPSHEPLLSKLGIQLRGPFDLAWGSWLEGTDLPAMGA